MFAATRRWFRRNRTPIAIGVGVVGAGYVVTQYVLSKINDARERMSSDRIAKEKYAIYEACHVSCVILTVSQLAPTIRAESGGLHLHSARTAAHGDDEHPRGDEHREDHI